MRQIILFLSIFPIFVFSNNTDTTRSSRFSVGISFSPDYCYRKLQGDASTNWIIELRNKNEVPKLGYTTGLNFAMKITKKITFETGVLFSDKGEKDKFQFTDINGTTQGQVRINYHYNYLDIPIKISYSVGSSKMHFLFFTGISTNIFLSQKATSIIKYNDGRKESFSAIIENNFKSVNPALLIGIGIRYDFAKKFYLKIEPTYRHSLSPIKDSNIKSYLFSGGINVGVYYQF